LRLLLLLLSQPSLFAHLPNDVFELLHDVPSRAPQLFAARADGGGVPVVVPGIPEDRINAPRFDGRDPLRTRQLRAGASEAVRAVARVSVGIRFEDLLDAGWRETLEADDEHGGAALPIVRVCHIVLVSVFVAFLLLLLLRQRRRPRGEEG
jgi:hypothetical protein